MEDGSNSEEEASQHQQIPIRVQNDMEFLKNSWANMAVDEEAEKRLLEALENEGDNEGETSEGFKVVQSKKKIQKQKRATTNIPLTRSKVGHAKPFK